MDRLLLPAQRSESDNAAETKPKASEDLVSENRIAGREKQVARPLSVRTEAATGCQQPRSLNSFRDRRHPEREPVKITENQRDS